MKLEIDLEHGRGQWQGETIAIDFERHKHSAIVLTDTLGFRFRR